MTKRVTLFFALCMILGATTGQADDVWDYGQYLSGECTSCHKLDGSGSDIPSIVGWDTENFIAALLTYRTGERTNPAMVSVVRALDDEQIKALAVYFASLKPK